MKSLSDEVVDRFVDAGHEIARCGLVRSSCGNLSMRLDEELFLITATGSWMSKLSREHVAVCRIGEGAALNEKRPSSEVGMHTGILRARPDVNAVLHFQAPCATALACRPSHDVDYAVIPEIPYYIGAVARIPYFTPGSRELAEAVTEAAREHDMVLMTNHGQVTVARDLEGVIQNAEFFELACEVILLGGDSIAALSPQAVKQLHTLRAKKTSRAV